MRYVLNRQFKPIIHKKALEFCTGDQIILDIWKSQFDFIAERISMCEKEEPMYPVIILTNFGKFVSKTRCRIFKKTSEEIKE